MMKGVCVALIVAGVALLVWGLRVSDSFSSDVSRVFTDSPTDKAIWMLIVGGAALTAGLVGLTRNGLRGT